MSVKGMMIFRSGSLPASGVSSGDFEALQAQIDAETARAIAAEAGRVPFEGFWMDVAQAAGEWEIVNTEYLPGKAFSLSTGTLLDNAAYRAMQVPVTPGDVMRFSGGLRGTTIALATWVNAAGAVIGTIHPGTASEIIYDGVVAVVPVGAVAVWMSGDIFALRFPLAERLVPGFEATTAPTNFAVSSDLALTEWVPLVFVWTASAFIDRQTGAVSANSAYRYAKIDVVSGEKLQLTGDISGTGIPLWIWYGASGEVIYSHGRGETAAVQLRDRVVTVPLGAVKIGISQLNSAVVPWSIKRQSRIASLPSYVAGSIAKDLKDWESVSLAPVPGSYLRASDGVLVANAAYRYAMVDCAAGDEFRLSADIFGSVISLAVWLNSANAVVSSYGPGSNSAAVQYRDVELTAPAGATRLGLTWRNTDAAAQKVAKSVRYLTIADYVAAKMGDPGHGYWSGKSIAWFGTSIPAGSASGRYPNLIADALGAEIYNMALSGSPVRAGRRAAVTAGDPYGFAGVSWGIATLGLAHTLAEKQDIIDNWATYRTLFSASSAPPTTLTTGQQNAILASSYETRLVSGNLGANRRDVYVFDHGFNDCSYADDLTTGTIGSRDRLTYYGAINYLIDLILADNPRASILFVGHYDAADPSRSTLIAAQQAIAAHWSRPLWRGWEALGWSSAVEVTTTGYWSSNLWVPSGGPSQTLSMNEVWTPDGVHPGQDASGDSIRRIVDAMTPWWQAVR